ncbi:MAG: glycosyltransferase family 39 protein [Proteobacteria bacterium]|nr:glycosyltransferase family 39 protein [Pseudomonadota bacterium]
MKIKTNLILITILCLYAIFLAVKVGAYAAGSDSSGYLNAAKLIASGKLHEKQRFIEGIAESEISQNAYLPLGFVASSREEIVPTYPLGLPILIALTSFLVGFSAAPHVVICLHSLASLILIYRLARILNLEKFWSALAAILLAINPLFFNYSLQLMSDMPSLFWCGLAVFSSLKSKEKASWAIVAGASVGMAVMIRPVNILIAFPLLIIFGKNWRNLIYCGFGGLPFAAALLILNRNLYGHFFTTGYGDLSELFGTQFFLASIVAYEKYLLLELTPLVVLAIGIFMPSLWRQNPRRSIILTAWIAPFFIFYSFYCYTSCCWWYMRFLLPIFPAIILAMVLTLRDIYESFPKFRRTIIITFLSLTFSWQASFSAVFPVITNESSEYFLASNWVKNNLEKDSILIAMQTSGALLQYTEFPIIRYDSVTRSELEKISEVAKKNQRPIYAMLFSFELDDVMKTKFPGKWEKVKETKLITTWRRINEK